MRIKLLLLAAAAGVLLPVTSALAHHSFAAEYDDKKPISLTGVVTKVEWRNTLIVLYVDVHDTLGNTMK